VRKCIRICSVIYDICTKSKTTVHLRLNGLNEEPNIFFHGGKRESGRVCSVCVCVLEREREREREGEGETSGEASLGGQRERVCVRALKRERGRGRGRDQR
jgi:hypothetical protein